MGEMGRDGTLRKTFGHNQSTFINLLLPSPFVGVGEGLYYSAFILARASFSFSSLAQSDMRM